MRKAFPYHNVIMTRHHIMKIGTRQACVNIHLQSTNQLSAFNQFNMFQVNLSHGCGSPYYSAMSGINLVWPIDSGLWDYSINGFSLETGFSGHRGRQIVVLLTYCVVCYFLFKIIWWRHQMEAFSALLALCAGNSPVTGEFPSQRPATRSFDFFFDLRLNMTMNMTRC